MLNILRRRYPIGKVQLYPALVQGEQAPESIAQALRKAGSDGCDVILMGRGGGSNEDLSAFQSEAVAAAVFESPVPVVSAVGHETDHCIADEVADLRAPTPSAAAELAVPSRETLADAVGAAEQNLLLAMQSCLKRHQMAFDGLTRRLEQQSPVHRITLFGEQFRSTEKRLHQAASNILRSQNASLCAAIDRLEAVSPVAILRRGYALVYSGETLLRDSRDVSPGDSVRIRLASGTVTAQITSCEGDAT